MARYDDEPEYWDIETGEPLYDEDLHARYDEMLDELEEVHIGSLSYMPSDVLKNVDPIAYRVGFSDWLDAETGETITDEELTDDDEDED